MFGFGMGVAWEHRPRNDDNGLRYFGQGLAVQRDDWRDRAKAAEAAVTAWTNRAQACETLAQQRAATATEQVGADSSQASRRAETAFDNGYRVGRIAGARTCKVVEDEKRGSGGPGPASIDGVLDDLSTRYNASAYRAP